MTAGSGAEEWRILDISITESNDADSEADDSGSQPIATTISSLVDTDIEAIEVFDMDLYDFGTTDGTNTEVTKIRIMIHWNAKRFIDSRISTIQEVSIHGWMRWWS